MNKISHTPILSCNQHYVKNLRFFLVISCKSKEVFFALWINLSRGVRLRVFVGAYAPALWIPCLNQWLRHWHGMTAGNKNKQTTKGCVYFKIGRLSRKSLMVISAPLVMR